MDPADLRGLPTLTVLPPWGSSIARWGKPWENRPMPPPRSIRGRPLAIHQGLLALTTRGQIRATAAGQRLARDLATVAERVGLSEAAVLDQLREDEGRVLCLVVVMVWARLAPWLASPMLISMGGGQTPVELDPWMHRDPERETYAWGLHDLSVVDGAPRVRGQQGIWRMP